MDQSQTTIAGALLGLVVFGLPCLYALVRPAPFWRLRFLFSSWAYRGGEPPEPSTAGLAVVRAVAALVLFLLGGAVVQAVDRGVWTTDRPSQAGRTTTTFHAVGGAPAGLQCGAGEQIVTVRSDYAGRPDGSVDLGDNPARTADAAIAEYRSARFPGLSGDPVRRSESEFVFHDANDRVSLVIQAASTPEGWYVPLYQACSNFEAQITQPSEGP